MLTLIQDEIMAEMGLKGAPVCLWLVVWRGENRFLFSPKQCRLSGKPGSLTLSKEAYPISQGHVVLRRTAEECYRGTPVWRVWDVPSIKCADSILSFFFVLGVKQREGQMILMVRGHKMSDIFWNGPQPLWAREKEPENQTATGSPPPPFGTFGT